MKIILTENEKEALEKEHKTERDGRVRDRLKAVLLSCEGWSQVDIAQALRIRPETVRDHLNDYQESKKLKPLNGGSVSRVSPQNTKSLVDRLQANTYLKVLDICAYVQDQYDISFTVSGMTKWLQNHEFSYKKPKVTPLKANIAEQEAFIKEYKNLLESTPDDEPIEFADGVHPTMATKITYGWIRRGKDHDKPIATTASRTRMNLMGSINLADMTVTVNSYETIDSEVMADHFKQLRANHPKAPKIHQILDRGSYNVSKKTREAAYQYGIILQFLPAYSPNLNPIERLWKVMNEYVSNNIVFMSAKEFREKITRFFAITWPKISHSMIGRINDNFQNLKQVSSS